MQIVFESDRHGPLELYLMNSDGSNQERLTFMNGDNHEPDWSPDGTKIIFVSFQNGNFDISVINPDGTGLRNITSHSANDFSPSWYPIQ